MDIDKTKCVGCGNCHIICTMGVISLDEDGKSVVNQDECVECATCYRDSGTRSTLPGLSVPSGQCYLCSNWAIWPMSTSARPGRSRPLNLSGRESCVPSSAIPPSSIREPASPAGEPTRSRATTSPGGSGRVRWGWLLSSVAPVGAPFRDIEKVAMALAPLEPVFEPENPVTHLIVDKKRAG